MSDAEREMRSLSRRAFLQAAVAVGAVYAGYRWINTQPDEDGVVWPLRRVLKANEKVARTLSDNRRLVATFPRAAAEDLKFNGDIGMPDDFDANAWKLHVSGLSLGLDELRALPHFEQVVEHKCVEGWSQVVWWGGARFADFLQKYPAPPATDYVSMATPDGGYYVGLEMAAALHPQTMLCWEMNGKPLSAEHGAPLRLVIPTKYGIKNIKRLGTITYAQQRPADYWAENGYDWYAGF